MKIAKYITYFANVNAAIGLVLMSLPILYLVAVNTPTVWYRLNPQALQSEIDVITKDPFAETFGSINFIPKVFAEAPVVDENVGNKNMLRINQIGIDTEIIQSKDEEAALEKGVWMMPGYGTPAKNDIPTILAAHRWGPVNISNEYRQKNMFINLPNLSNGDKIEIAWEGQLYTYRVTSVSTSQTVDRLADLVLITCKYFDQPERIIVYAERIS